MALGPAEVTMAFSRLLDPRGHTPRWEHRQSFTLPPEMVVAPHVQVQSTSQGALLVLVELLICLSKVLSPLGLWGSQLWRSGSLFPVALTDIRVERTGQPGGSAPPPSKTSVPPPPPNEGQQWEGYFSGVG